MRVGFGIGGHHRGGSGGPQVMRALQAFAEDANSTAWYGPTVQPTAEYYADIDKTVIAWESYNGKNSEERECHICWYDHATGKFSPTYFVATSLIVNDSHSVPAICRTGEGHFVVFYGAHSVISNAMTVTISTNPNDISAWTALPNLSGPCGYPHPCVVGNEIFLFVRMDDNEAGTVRYGELNIGATTGASITWGGFQRFADLGADSRYYGGDFFVEGTNIIGLFTRSNFGDSIRRGIYGFIYNTLDDGISDLAGGNTVAAATWQAGGAGIDLATWNANFRIFDHGSRFGAAPAACVADGKRHLIFQNGASNDDELYYMVGNVGSTSFSAPAKVADIFQGGGSFAIHPGPANGVDIWYRKTNNSLYRRRRTAAGVMGPEKEMFKPRPGQQLDNPVAPRNADPDLSLLFANSNDDETVEGNFNIYACSQAAAIVSRGIRGTIGALCAAAGIVPSELTATARAAYSDFLDAALASGHWQRLRAFWLLDSINLIPFTNWKLHRWDLREIGTGTGFDEVNLGWTSNGSDRYLDTGMSLSQFFTATDALIGMACSGPAGDAMRLGNVGGTNFHGCILSATNSGGTNTVFGFNSTNSHQPANTSNTGVFEGYRDGADLQVYRNGVALAAPGTITDAAASDVSLVIGRASTTPIFAASTQRCYAVWAGDGIGAGASRDTAAAAFATALTTLINTLAPGTL